MSFTSVLETEVKLTSVLETEVKISLPPAPPHDSNSPIINIWKSFPPKPPDYSVLQSNNEVMLKSKEVIIGP